MRMRHHGSVWFSQVVGARVLTASAYVWKWGEGRVRVRKVYAAGGACQYQPRYANSSTSRRPSIQINRPTAGRRWAVCT